MALEYTDFMLRESPVKTVTTFEEFLEFESRSQERHEFVDGNLFVMAGGTDRHNLMAVLLTAMLFQQAFPKGCYAQSNDVLIRTPNGKGYYPDVFVYCDRSLDEPRVKYRPSIIIEVLSDSTEAIDRGEKWQAYQQIPSLEQYILLSQTQPIAEVYSRSDSDWRYKKLEGDSKLVFPSLEFEVVLSSLYQNLPPLE
jgi:Uma2 family endonuclease